MDIDEVRRQVRRGDLRPIPSGGLCDTAPVIANPAGAEKAFLRAADAAGTSSILLRAESLSFASWAAFSQGRRKRALAHIEAALQAFAGLRGRCDWVTPSVQLHHGVYGPEAGRALALAALLSADEGDITAACSYLSAAITLEPSDQLAEWIDREFGLRSLTELVTRARSRATAFYRSRLTVMELAFVSAGSSLRSLTYKGYRLPDICGDQLNAARAIYRDNRPSTEQLESASIAYISRYTLRLLEARRDLNETVQIFTKLVDRDIDDRISNLRAERERVGSKFGIGIKGAFATSIAIGAGILLFFLMIGPGAGFAGTYDWSGPIVWGSIFGILYFVFSLIFTMPVGFVVDLLFNSWKTGQYRKREAELALLRSSTGGTLPIDVWQLNGPPPPPFV